MHQYVLHVQTENIPQVWEVLAKPALLIKSPTLLLATVLTAQQVLNQMTPETVADSVTQDTSHQKIQYVNYVHLEWSLKQVPDLVCLADAVLVYSTMNVSSVMRVSFPLMMETVQHVQSTLYLKEELAHVKNVAQVPIQQ